MNPQTETLTLNYPDGGRTVLPLAKGTVRKWERAAARRKISVEEYTRRFLMGLLDRTKQSAATYGRRELPGTTQMKTKKPKRTFPAGDFELVHVLDDPAWGSLGGVSAMLYPGSIARWSAKAKKSKKPLEVYIADELNRQKHSYTHVGPVDPKQIGRIRIVKALVIEEFHRPKRKALKR